MNSRIAIGRPVWTTFGCLKKGFVAGYNEDPFFYKIEYSPNDKQPLSPGSVHESPEEAFKVCCDNAEYWALKSDDLKAIIDRVNNY